MKIATYNIWNNDAGMPHRFQQLTDEITKLDADILCLQEVSDKKHCDILASLCGYSHSHCQTGAGLAILSKYEIIRTSDLKFSISASILTDQGKLHVINVHLPWDSASAREKIIVDIADGMAKEEADATLLLGDFNSSASSSIHRFLTGEQSLFEYDTCFFDLAEVYAEMMDKPLRATLNFRENPRWGVAQPKNTIELNKRVDWILLKDPYPADFPVLKDCRIFGTRISGRTHLAASDHFGVCAELDFPHKVQ